MAKRYTITPLFPSPAMSVRPDHHTNNSSVGKLEYGKSASGDELWESATGDKWLLCTEGVPKLGWVAIIHEGKAYCKLTDNAPSPTTPPTSNIVLTHIVYVYSDGSMTANGNPVP